MPTDDPLKSFIIQSLNEKQQLATNGEEYWMARDIQGVLGYASWQSFFGVINRATQACQKSGVNPAYHFSHTTNKIETGKGASLDRADCFLTRYACYLIAINGDPAKPEVAAAQTYFTVQTRKQEIQEALSEDDKRIELRERVRAANRALSGAAANAGVNEIWTFQ